MTTTNEVIVFCKKNTLLILWLVDCFWIVVYFELPLRMAMVV